MRYPKFLPANGTIGYVAPSFGANTEPYTSSVKHSVEVFAGLGHKVICGPNTYAGEGIGISNTPEKCGSELTEFYCNDDTDVLISVGGGELMCETMDHVDFARIKNAAPKWYMGYSDNTNFTFLLNTICDVASVYAPCASTFGAEPMHQSVRDAYEVIRGLKDCVSGYGKWEKESLKNEENPLAPYNLTEPSILYLYNPENNSTLPGATIINDAAVPDGYTVKTNSDIHADFEGRLIGGCMDCLNNLLGTPYDKVKEFNERYADEGIVWFMEACMYDVFSIRRALWQMDRAGWFKHVKGFIFGRPMHFNEGYMGLDQYRAVTDILGKYKVPIIMDADIGHISPMMPIVSGSHGNISLSENEITIKFSFT